MGPHYSERYYYQAIEAALKEIKIPYQKQVKTEVFFKDKKIIGYIDFVIDQKRVLEVKKGERFFKSNIDQILGYLKVKNLKLGILVNFTRRGVQFKRIINIRN